ncbi:RDD family protein [Knoellia sp. CPCC 206435]|uniref:RDD family protein n=1 Tax=Knoellia terrae TaxID=3404797 RepID=UPI003B43BB00
MSQPFDPNQPPAQNPQQPYAGGAPAPYQSAPQVNPYGGGGQAFPGSKAYVEQHFGPVSGFGRRAGALVIDTLLSLIGIIPMVIGAVLLVMAAPDVDELGATVDGTGDGGQAAIGGLLIALGILLTIGIQVWNRIFRMGRTGQSVGKKMLGLKLINEQTGQPIGAMQSFLRELLGGLINQVVYLSYLWMLWDDNKQTLADKIVHSTVIDVPKS